MDCVINEKTRKLDTIQSAKNNGLQICLRDLGGFSLQREILFFVPHQKSCECVPAECIECVVLYINI